MKILIYINSMMPAGGIERVVSRHISYFLKYGKIRILTKDMGGSFYFIPDCVEWDMVSYKRKLNMHSVIHRVIQSAIQLVVLRDNVQSKIQQFNPDFIYCVHPMNLLELYVYGVGLKKIIVTEHGSAYGYNIIYRIIKRMLYSKVYLYVVPTKLDYDIYSRWKKNTRYIPNPLPFTQREKAKLEEKTVLTIGRLTADKQHFLLLDIWKRIHIDKHDWKLRIIGKGENYSALLHKIKEYKLEGTVEILTPRKDVIKEYINSSIFVLTSRYEGFGMVLAEAMECGVPCVAFNCPSGPRDIIKNEKDGFLVPDGDSNLFISKLLLLMENADLRKKMGKIAADNIKRFHEDVVEKMWDDLFAKEVVY
jgi:glycosyltransferase involved in cell wall biosynthesis